MKESKIETLINKLLQKAVKKAATLLYKRTGFWTYSWGINENVDIYLISEESWHGYHRFGTREDSYFEKDCSWR